MKFRVIKQGTYSGDGAPVLVSHLEFEDAMGHWWPADPAQVVAEFERQQAEIERLQKERDAARLLNRNAIGVARQLYRMFLADMSEYTQETLPTEHPWLKEDD